MAPSLNENKEKNIPIREAASRFGYSTGYLSNLCRTGKIIGKYSHNGWSVNTASLERFIKAQAERKEARARELAREREEEYRVHRPARTPDGGNFQFSIFNFQNNTNTKKSKEFNFQNNFLKQEKPTSKPRVAEFELAESSFFSHAVAVATALLVIGAGAFVAQTASVSRVADATAVLAREAATGFSAAFGEVPSRIAARLFAAREATRATVARVAAQNEEATALIASPALIAFDFSSAHPIRDADFQSARTPGVLVSNGARMTTPLLTVADMQSSALAAYEMLMSPSRIPRAFVDAYFATGERAYAGINALLASYRALIDASGARALALAATARDALAQHLTGLGAGLAGAPRFVAQMNLALGNAVIGATHALIGAETSLAYGTAAAAPAAARATVALIGDTGDALARAAAATPQAARRAFLALASAPSRIAPRIASAVFDAEYAAAQRFIAATGAVSERYLALVEGAGRVAYAGTKGSLALASNIVVEVGLPQFPISNYQSASIASALQDTYLGALGKSAVALQSLSGDVGLALDSIAHTPVLAAASPALSAGEQIALATYDTLHNFYDSTTSTLALLLFGSPPPVIVVNTVLPAPSTAVATSTPVRQTAPAPAPATYPTYTTVVQGVSQEYVAQSLDTLRNGILATMNGMLQPVAAQSVTNMTTIQQVNRIEKLDGLIVTNGDFRSGTLDNARITNGISVAAALGDFSSLTADSATLGATTVTDALTTSGGILSYTSATAPFFSATSTSATSTFLGGLTIGTSQFVVEQATGNIGIGTTSPFRLLTLSNAGASGQLAFADTAATATERYASIGFSRGLLSFNTLDDAFATTSRMVIDASGRVGIGTTSPSSALSVAGDFMLGGTSGAVLTGAGAGLTFTGTGNHDITAQGGTLRIGSNTIIGNIEALDDTVDIGTPATRFDKLYANEVNATTLVGTLTGGNLIAETFNINSDNATDDTENSFLSFERGTVSPNALLTWNAADSAKRFELNHPLFVQDASASTTNTTLSLQSVAGQTGDVFRVASSSSATNFFTITGAGNVGVGTTTPWGLLSVNPNGTTGPAFVVGSSTQCVTGDTLLRIRRRRKGGRYKDDETVEPDDYGYDFLTIRITDIEPGDEVLSLNPENGKFEYHRIKGLIDTGMNEVFKMRTASGRYIETTANHPYLTRARSARAKKLESRIKVAVDYANIKAWLLQKGLTMDLDLLSRALARAGAGDVRFYYGTDTRNASMDSFFEALKRFGYAVITKPVSYFKVSLIAILTRDRNRRWLEACAPGLRTELMREASRLDAAGIELLEPKANFDIEIATDALDTQEEYDTFVLFSGDGDFVPLVEKLREKGKRVITIAGRKMFSGQLKNVSDVSLSLETFADELPGLITIRKPKPAHKGRVLKKCSVSIASVKRLSSLLSPSVDKSSCAPHVTNDIRHRRWAPVRELSVGQEIAIMASELNVQDGGKQFGLDQALVFEEIVSIENTGIQHTYDIEVEGTHNFVAGHLINTKTGESLTSEEETRVLNENGHDVENMRFNNWLVPSEYTKAENSVVFGGIVAHNTAFIVANGGNVGIGTTSPSAKLSIKGGGTTTGRAFAISDSANAEKFTVLDNGNVGIGTTSPAYRLNVYKLPTSSTDYLARFTSPALHSAAVSIGYTGGKSMNLVAGTLGTSIMSDGFIGFSTNSNLDIDNGTNERMRIDSIGNVGIGTTSPATKLEVGGSTNNVTFDGYLNCTGFTSDANGLLTCVASDERLKENVATLATSSALAGINALNPVSFNWRNTSLGANQQFGLLAQEVQSAFPNLVQTTNPTALTPGGTLTVNYTGLIAPMILAIQELDARTRQILGSDGVLSIASGVNAQCVTGDTRLRRRRRRADGSWEYDEVDIADVQAGDEIQSLDERTGRVAYSRVNALMPMGEQEVYELVTKSGRRIRTTANHPYLARIAAKKV